MLSGREMVCTLVLGERPNLNGLHACHRPLNPTLMQPHPGPPHAPGLHFAINTDIAMFQTYSSSLSGLGLNQVLDPPTPTTSNGSQSHHLAVLPSQGGDLLVVVVVDPAGSYEVFSTSRQAVEGKRVLTTPVERVGGRDRLPGLVLEEGERVVTVTSNWESGIMLVTVGGASGRYYAYRATLALLRERHLRGRGSSLLELVASGVFPKAVPSIGVTLETLAGSLIEVREAGVEGEGEIWVLAQVLRTHDCPLGVMRVEVRVDGRGRGVEVGAAQWREVQEVTCMASSMAKEYRSASVVGLREDGQVALDPMYPGLD